MHFEILIQPTAERITAAPHETLLAAALRQGVALPYGCRDGKCGSCAAKLLSGSIQYPSGLIEALHGKPAGTCLTCQAVPQSDVAIEVRQVQRAPEIAPRVLPCRLERKERLNHDVMRLWLKLPEQQRLHFLPGQYLHFILRDGRRRAFSIANPPHADGLIELHVRQVPGGEFTGFVFDKLAERSILRIEGPLGTFSLQDDRTNPLLLVAGGTGLAPIKSIIEHALHIGDIRPIQLYWGVRSRVDLYLPDLPFEWERRHPDLRYMPVLSMPDADWTGRRGLVHEAVLADHASLAAFDVYLSGPPAMIAAGTSAFLARGVAPEQLFADAFTYAADRQDG